MRLDDGSAMRRDITLDIDRYGQGKVQSGYLYRTVYRARRAPGVGRASYQRLGFGGLAAHQKRGPKPIGVLYHF